MAGFYRSAVHHIDLPLWPEKIWRIIRGEEGPL
jgi:hypothetical protein